MELMKGVHRIAVYANCALLVDDRVILVDTSKDAAAKAILDYLPKARMKPRDIATIILTHTHPDHVGGLATMKQQAPKARVAAHEADADFVSKKVPNYPHKPIGGKPSPWQGVPVDDRLKDGQTYEGLRVIHAPGHTPGSIALLDEDRSLLLAGDTLCTDPESTDDRATLKELGVTTMSDAFNSDPRQHKQSIKKLAAFEFEAAIIGHDAAITSGASRKVQELAKRL